MTLILVFALGVLAGGIVGAVTALQVQQRRDPSRLQGLLDQLSALEEITRELNDRLAEFEERVANQFQHIEELAHENQRLRTRLEQG